MNDRATYSYTADGQGELDALRARYDLKISEDALPAVREIDRRASRRAATRAIVLGTAALLTFGAGLSAILTARSMAFGMPLGFLGIAAMIAMPALYDRLLRRERKRARLKVEETVKSP